MSIFLRWHGKVPSKSNRYRIVRKGRHYSLAKDAEVQQFEDALASLIGQLSHGHPIWPMPQRVEIWIVWHRVYNDGRRRDLGNIEKAICDGLTKGAAWEDDCQVTTIISTVRYDAEKEGEWLEVTMMSDPLQPQPSKRKPVA